MAPSAGAATPDGDYGLGIFDYGEGWIGHTGQLIGWESLVAYNTDTGAACVVMVNETGSLGSTLELVRSVFPELVTGCWEDERGAPPDGHRVVKGFSDRRAPFPFWALVVAIVVGVIAGVAAAGGGSAPARKPPAPASPARAGAGSPGLETTGGPASRPDFHLRRRPALWLDAREGSHSSCSRWGSL